MKLRPGQKVNTPVGNGLVLVIHDDGRRIWVEDDKTGRAADWPADQIVPRGRTFDDLLKRRKTMR